MPEVIAIVDQFRPIGSPSQLKTLCVDGTPLIQIKHFDKEPFDSVEFELSWYFKPDPKGDRFSYMQLPGSKPFSEVAREFVNLLKRLKTYTSDPEADYEIPGKLVVHTNQDGVYFWQYLAETYLKNKDATFLHPHPYFLGEGKVLTVTVDIDLISQVTDSFNQQEP